MFGEFLNIIFKSIKLDRSLYNDNKNFGEASIYFAGLIMILDGVAGAVAANTIMKTAIGMSGLTAILRWFNCSYPRIDDTNNILNSILDFCIFNNSYQTNLRS